MTDQSNVALRPSEVKGNGEKEKVVRGMGMEWTPQMIETEKELSTADAPTLEGVIQAIDMAHDKTPNNPGILWTRLVAMSKLIQS